MTTNHVVDQLRDTVPRPVTDRAVVVAVSGTSVFFPATRTHVPTLALECNCIVNTNEIGYVNGIIMPIHIQLSRMYFFRGHKIQLSGTSWFVGIILLFLKGMCDLWSWFFSSAVPSQHL